MADQTNLAGSVALHTGNEAEVGIQNLERVRAGLQAAIAAETQARIDGDNELAEQLQTEISQFRAEITQITDALSTRIETLDNKLANHISTTTDEIARLDALIDAARQLEEGELAGVLDAIEEAAVKILESGKIEQIAARLNVIIDGTSMALADAIKALWKRPVLARTVIGERDSAGWAKGTTLHFADGRTATTTMSKAVSDGVTTLTYTAANFLGLGIDAVAVEKYVQNGDIMRMTEKGELFYEMSVESAAAIVVEAPDIDGDGQAPELGDGDVNEGGGAPV